MTQLGFGQRSAALAGIGISLGYAFCCVAEIVFGTKVAHSRAVEQAIGAHDGAFRCK